MPRKYSHIQEHEKEILELRDQGMILREIGEKPGFIIIGKSMRFAGCAIFLAFPEVGTTPTPII